MEDHAFDEGGSEEVQPQSDDLKKKAAAQSKQAAQHNPEDQSRGALHYGEDHEGETSGSAYQDAAAPQEASAQRPQDDSEPSAAGTTDTAPSDAPAGDTNADVTGDEDDAQDQRTTGTRDTGERNGTPQADTAQAAPARSATAQQSGNADTAPTTDDGPTTEANGEAAEQADGAPEETTAENSAPTSVSMSNTAVAENAEGAIVGELSVSDQDRGDSHTYTLSDERFEVVDGFVKLKDGISLDHEEIQNLTLDVTATDDAGASVTQSFEIAVTDMNEAPVEMALSNHAIAGNADGAIVGTLSVTDQDIGDSHSFAVSDDRFEVVGNQVKLKDGVTLDPDEAANLTLDVTATDSGGASVVQSFDIAVADVPDTSIGTGFHARYFDMNQTIRSIDDVDWNGDVTHQELVDDINYTNSRNSFWENGSKDTFGVQITGNIEVEEGGTFDFHIGGDDGVVLYINGQEVVDNDGLHGFRTRSGEIDLEPGTHVIEVRYFENYGHAGLKVEWEGPGLDGRELLTPPGVDDLHTVNGMPLNLNLDTGAGQPSDGTISQMIEGLPPGTIVQAGDHMVEVGENGTADITDWDTSMMQITPPVDFTGTVNAQVTTEVTMENGDTAVSMQELSFDVDQADITPPEMTLQGGFRASYFDVDHSLSRLDQINWDADPTKEEIVGEVNYKNGRDSFWEGGDDDTFGARITGEITVEEGGNYDFFIGGDDGVVLYINGVEVIDNDGLHGFRTRSGEIDLEPGTHEVEIRYFENYGHAGLKLEWDGPDTDGRELVTADTDLAVPENGTLEMGLSIPDMGDESSVIVSGIPADTILVSGEDSIVADGSDLDLSGWDLDMVELMPPPGFEGIISAEFAYADTAFNGEPIEATRSFEIEVGDISNAPSGQGGDEDVFLADADDNSGNQGWAGDQAEPRDDDGDHERDDDVMDEPVSESGSSEQSHEMTDSYERNDW